MIELTEGATQYSAMRTVTMTTVSSIVQPVQSQFITEHFLKATAMVHAGTVVIILALVLHDCVFFNEYMWTLIMLLHCFFDFFLLMYLFSYCPPFHCTESPVLHLCDFKKLLSHSALILCTSLTKFS